MSANPPPIADLNFTRQAKVNGIEIIEWLVGPGERATGELLEIRLQAWKRERRIDQRFGIRFTRVATKAQFLAAIADVKNRVNREVGPILHVECHGSVTGLSGDRRFSEEATWREIRVPLLEVNVASGHNLILITSACKGFSALGTVSAETFWKAPYFGVIGPDSDLSPDDLQNCFEAFYDAFFRTASFDAAVDAGQRSLPRGIQLLRSQSDRVFCLAAAKEIVTGLSVSQISRRVAAILGRLPATGLRNAAGSLRRMLKRKREPESFRELHAIWAHHDIPGNAQRLPFKPELIEGHVARLRSGAPV